MIACHLVKTCVKCGIICLFTHNKYGLCKSCLKRQRKQRYVPRNHERQFRVYLQHVERTYGISKVEFARIVNEQNYCCAICGVDLRTIRRALDHDHKTKKVRALLCRDCNWFVSAVESRPHLVQKILDYLKRHEENAA